MPKTLIIKHLPPTLSFHEKEHLLKHFGAEKVWEKSEKRDYVFATFSTDEIARSSLVRLHQLQIAQRRLVVEYSFEKEPISDNPKQEDNSTVTTNLKNFLRVLNAWNPSVDFYHPPPVHLRYKYPEITPKIAVNIIHALFSHKSFYIQLLHLMNKMSLDTPFDDNENAYDFFKSNFRQFFVDEIHIPAGIESQSESEISSDENEQKKQPLPTLLKRKHTLPVTRKRPAAILSTAILPKSRKSNVTEEIFDTVTPVQEPKKISLVVNHDALNKQVEQVEVVGELGKFQKEEQLVTTEESCVEPEQPTITKKELLQNRISYRDMKVLPVFKNYHPGQPSMRLYIKNLAKTVTEQDVIRIYRRYVEHLSDDKQIGFDVRVMQEGRMKGQGFVTFPSIELAETALTETNGFMLKDRPMVVQFARAANKKTIE